jgi:hypothetical protein
MCYIFTLNPPFPEKNPVCATEDLKCIEFIVLFTFERISRPVAQELFFIIFQIIVLSPLISERSVSPTPLSDDTAKT